MILITSKSNKHTNFCVHIFIINMSVCYMEYTKRSSHGITALEKFVQGIQLKWHGSFNINLEVIGLKSKNWSCLTQLN